MAHAIEGTGSADLALAVYLDELVEGRRVLFLGDAESGAPDRLAARAADVRVLSPEGRERPRRSRSAVLRPGPIALEEHYDVVIVPSLDAVHLAAPDRMSELRRLLGPGGLLVAGTDTRGGIGYEQLFALASGEFASVRMLGQASFSGFVLVDFESAAHAGVTFDGSLVSEEADVPERYFAVCADDGAALDGYAVIRVPETREVERPTATAAARRRRRGDRGEAPRSAEGPSDDEARAKLAELERELALRADEVTAASEHAEELEERLASRTAELERVRSALENATERLEEARASAAREGEENVERARARIEELERALAEAERSGGGAEEHARLERALAEVGHSLKEARIEVERRGVLVRDMAEEMKELHRALALATEGAVAGASAGALGAPSEPASGGDDALREERDRAVARALDAEAARAEAQFSLDEVMGRLAVATDAVETMRVREADLAGRVRGLTSRAAEAEELREQSLARLSLAEHDLSASRERIRVLERELGEMREQLEIEISRAHARAAASEDTDPRVVGDLTRTIEELRDLEGTLAARVSELEAARESEHERAALLEEERDHARADALRLTALVTSLENRFDGASRGYRARIAELAHDVAEARERAESLPRLHEEKARLRRDVAELEGEISGLRVRLDDREAALASREAEGVRSPATAGELDAARAEIERLVSEVERCRGELARARVDLEAAEGRSRSLEARLSAARTEAAQDGERVTDALKDEADRLRQQVAELKDAETDLTVRLADAEELSELEANRANDLANAVAARDALVNRLQLDLADEERRARHAEERFDRLHDENARLRSAVVGASERVSETEVLEKRIDEAEGALATMRARAEIAEARLAGSDSLLRDTRRVLDELSRELDLPPITFGTTAVGLEAPNGEWTEPGSDVRESARAELSALEGRVRELERDAEDRETLMRSLTAQLEERADRIRALERRLGEGEGREPAAEERTRRELMELEERAARLSEELAHERKARRDAESGAAGRRTEELKELHETLGDRDKELLVLRGKVSSAERDVKTLREAAVQARAGLEELLGMATANGDPGTAERVGGLLRILGRF